MVPDPRSSQRRLVAAVALVATLGAGVARGQARVDEAPHGSASAAMPFIGTPGASGAATKPSAGTLREDTAWIDVSVADLYGRRETRRIPVTVFRPPGDGPFPLVIMNHGRASAERRARQGRQRFEPLSRYFVARGFAVLLPTRVGYADTYGDFDPESNGGCSTMRLEPQAEAIVEQVLATLAYAQTLPFVDASRWIVAGQSVGGLGSVATAWHRPPGLVGGLNFAGGTGGDPDRSPGRPCQPERIASFWGRQAAAAAAVPMLWLYWENDEYWGAENPKRWHAAWTAGGGKAEFHQLAAVGAKGHGGVSTDAEHWTPTVDAWLAALAFPAPCVAAPATLGARLANCPTPASRATGPGPSPGRPGLPPNAGDKP